MQHIVINDLICDGCGSCVDDCPTDGVYIESGKAYINEAGCTACGQCIPGCHVRAISLEESTE